MVSIESIFSGEDYSNIYQAGNAPMIVLNHLAQMRMFGNRQGIEFYPDQDNELGSRKDFIDQVVKANELELHYDRFMDSMLLSGQVLIYWRPNSKGSYDIRVFDKNSFRVFYNLEQKLEKVIIRFYYYEQSNLGGFNGLGGTSNANKVKRWVRMTITNEQVIQEYSVDGQIPSWDTNYRSSRHQVLENTLGFIPCVVARNNSLGIGQEGVGEFEPYREQIEKLEYMREAMEENLAFFGNPILAATRSPSELVEITSLKSSNLTKAHTLASEAGWYGGDMVSTRKSTPRNQVSAGANLRLKKVIGNVANDERFAFVNPPPISVDHARYVQQQREAIHFALGGIDETGIHASATAYEMKTVYGKVATTALRKARALYEYGFCKVFEDMILVEENLFRKTLALALKKEVNEMTDEFINQLLEKSGGMVPEGVFGLPPLGKRKVNWRWTGPVFEDSPDDMQKKSIVVRNLQELGVRSLDALTFLFPDKTQKEKQGMLAGGYPFRYLNAVAGTTGQLLGLYGQMTQLPSQNNPNMPMASQLPVEPMVQKSLETIYNELSYARPIEQSSSSESPYTTGNSAYQQWLQSINPTGNPTGTIQPTNGGQSGIESGNGVPTGGWSSVPSGWGWTIPRLEPNTYSVAGALPSSGDAYGSSYGTGAIPYGTGAIPPEYVAGLPTAGTTVVSEQQSGNVGSPVQQSGLWGKPIGNGSITSPVNTGAIPPDLAINADQPNSIWQQLSQSSQPDSINPKSRNPKPKSGKPKPNSKSPKSN